MKIFASMILFFSLSSSILCSTEFDLQSLRQPFVLSTVKIEIPGCAKAFNPSVVRWKGRLLLSFRLSDPIDRSLSKIGLVWIDENFKPIAAPQFLNTREGLRKIPCRSEDARLFTVGDSLYVIFGDCKFLDFDPNRFKLSVGKIKYKKRQFSLEFNEEIGKIDNDQLMRCEKNWVPFSYKNKLFFAYTLNPHRILDYNLKELTCKSFIETDRDIFWEWGQLRGGTPALFVDGFYLGFFHSSEYFQSVQSGGKRLHHYFMGAYVFNQEPPFSIEAISPEPIVGPGFYNGPIHPPLESHHRVVFPGGFIHSSKFIWVVYGRQDCEAWVVKLDKKGLLNSLVNTR